MIELKKVTKLYELGGEKIYALDNVSITIGDGDFLAVMGPSGSGKSTLANIIGGLDTPDSGQVLVDNRNIATMRDKDLSKYRNEKVGFIFQSFNLQPTLTAVENVTVPLLFAGVPAGQRKKRAIQCLKAVGLENRLNHKPGQLSGGQRQRVCIARALVNQPAIIIADEPTGNLDSKKGSEIVSLLESLNRQEKITLVVITHDKTVASEARKVLTMKDGRLA
ncbi:MAG: ABC transporter ATP-binding protein [Candidatus Kerfeldbacteria bacterium]|nr:ABC transporter ATP-binding protein [Candidatus Kerfeldbacteria bacterium]